MSNSNAVARDEFFDSLLGDFLDESSQLLDRLNENLLQLDDWVRDLGEDHKERCDDELMNEMFRSAHSLKGLSGMLGLGEINNLTHKVENVFDAARKDELIISGDCVELMFQAVDRLVAMIDTLADSEAEEVDCQSVLDSIQNLLQEAGVERKQSTQEDAERALNAVTEELEAEVAAAVEDTPPASASTEEPTSTPEDTTTLKAAPQAVVDQRVATPEPQGEIDHFDGLDDESEINGKYLSIFIDETELSLDSLAETLLALEGGGTRRELGSLLIISHRIKGSAASVGLNRAAKLAHLMEDLLQDLLDNNGSLSAQVTDAMLTCTDALRVYVDGLKKGRADSDSFSDLARNLLAARTSAQPTAVKRPTPEATPADDLPDPIATVGAASSGEAAPQARRRAKETPPGAAPPIVVTEDLRARVGANAPEGVQVLIGGVRFRPKLPLVGLKARLVFEKLSNQGDVCYLDPSLEQMDQLEEIDAIYFGVVTEAAAERVCGQLWIAGVESLSVEPLSGSTCPTDKMETPAIAATSGSASAAAPRKASSPPATQAAAKMSPAPAAAKKPSARADAAKVKSRPPDTNKKPTETLRVEIDRLDQLMNLAGQLVINKARFSQISDRLKSTLGGQRSQQTLRNVFNSLEKMASGRTDLRVDTAHLQAELEAFRSGARRLQVDLEVVRREIESLSRVRVSVNDLLEAVHQLDRVTDGIQQSVMDTRMVAIGPLFGRFKRVIRDITRANGKEIQLVIKGEKTELDKRMIDELGDPLIHMIRNSADHGIELPDVREAAGKPRQGTVTLDAFHRGNSIFIQVTDDGKGLDPDRILRKAVEKGLVTSQDAEKMTPHQIYQLIWEPGLTTAEKVTEVSGRGMGMDIVKSKIEDLNGACDLDSVRGESTTLTIKLPLTLAILPCLMVDIEGDIFAMPMESVVEIVSLKRDDLTTVHGKSTTRVRGRVISTVDLDELFTWRRVSRGQASQRSNEATLVIIGDDGHEIGMIVDQVLGEEDVVIKSMAENYRNVAGVAGASILGDGRISLILDIAALIGMASNNTNATVLS